MLKQTFVATAAGMIACGAMAMEPVTGPLDQTERGIAHGLTEVSDAQLAGMRGRYVASPNEFLYFGVQMMTTWHSPDNQILEAGARMNLDFSGAQPAVSFSPTVSIVSQQTGPANLATTEGRTITSDGLHNITGMTQSVQLAGDHNQVTNVTSIEFLDQVPETQLTAEGPRALALANDQGGAVQAALTDNRVEVRVLLDGQGLAEQIIQGSGQGGGHGALQSITTLGDHHQVTNSLQMALVERAASQRDNIMQGVGISLDTLRGLK